MDRETVKYEHSPVVAAAKIVNKYDDEHPGWDKQIDINALATNWQKRLDGDWNSMYCIRMMDKELADQSGNFENTELTAVVLADIISKNTLKLPARWEGDPEPFRSYMASAFRIARGYSEAKDLQLSRGDPEFKSLHTEELESYLAILYTPQMQSGGEKKG
jgi:hypothetical protein